MITLAPVSDKKKIHDRFVESSLEPTESSGCVEAKLNGEIIGFSLYTLDSSTQVIFKIEPENDLMLADGILRSTLHLANRRGIKDVYYSGDSSLYKRLGFIKNEKERLLDISKLTGSCCHK